MPDISRPPGVEAFLPIGALVSLKHFIFTGTINRVHPSGLIIFLIACMTAMIVKKGFCSWICPFGLLSEYLAKLHGLMFKNNLHLPSWLDYILRSIKYLLAGFFIWSIFFKMPIGSIEQFIQSPYNRFADVKMLHFFTQVSQTALIVIFALLALSIFIKYFWCRYLCPYGAVLGIISFMSLGKIRRDPEHCTECGKCEQHCPGLINIRQKKKIQSSECTACLTCVQKCPEKKAIGFFLGSGKMKMGHVSVAVVLILLFLVGIFMAKLSGNWQNNTSKAAYLRYVLQSNMFWNGQGPIDPDKREKMIQIMKNIQAQKAKSMFPPD
ncbi:MAG: 4Fe-4S binding protein [Desulfobacula sp.]|nr:4Fe-4S binding protein [Desulfobacula sp.]